MVGGAHRHRGRAGELARLALAALLVVGCSRSGSEKPAPASAEADSTSSAPATRCADWLRVEVPYPGASPAEVEHGVVRPLEEVLGEIDGVETMVGTATEGRANVWAKTRATALELVQPQILARLSSVTSLPEEAGLPVVLRAGPPRAQWVVVVRGPRLQLDAVVDAMSFVRSGEAEVRGRSPSQLTISLDSKILRAFGLDPRTVVTSIERAMVGADLDVQGLEAIPLASRGGSPVRLMDLANLRLHEADGPWARSAGEAARLLLVATDDASKVREEVARVAASLPPGFLLSVAGQLVPRGCASPAVDAELDGDLELIDVAMPPGTSREEMEALIGRIGPVEGAIWLGGERLLSFAPRERVGGLQLLIPADAPRRAEVVRALHETPGLRSVGPYGAGRAHVIVVLEHPDSALLREGAEWLTRAARERGLNVGAGAGSRPELQFEIDRHAAARLGLTSIDIAQQMRLLAFGQTVGQIQDGKRRLSVHVEVERSTDQLGSAPIRTPDGTEVPLSAVAQLRQGQEDERIVRIDGRRVRHVQLWIDARDRETTVELVDTQLLPALAKAHPELRARRQPGP